MSITYTLLMYFVHSYLETSKDRLIYKKGETTVENFRDNSENNEVCLEIFTAVFKNFNYELSWNQTANGINLFLKAHKII